MGEYWVFYWNNPSFADARNRLNINGINLFNLFFGFTPKEALPRWHLIHKHISMQKIVFFLALLISISSYGQIPGGARPGGGANGQNMNIGRFYGRIMDANTNKSVQAASVQLVQTKMDSVTKQRKDVV